MPFEITTANARALEKAGAADVIAQDELTVEWLASYVMQVAGRAIVAGGTSAGCPCVRKYTCRKVATLIEQVHHAKNNMDWLSNQGSKTHSFDWSGVSEWRDWRSCFMSEACALVDATLFRVVIRAFASVRYSNRFSS